LRLSCSAAGALVIFYKLIIKHTINFAINLQNYHLESAPPFKSHIRQKSSLLFKRPISPSINHDKLRL
jgi:hypothetical protein